MTTTATTTTQHQEEPRFLIIFVTGNANKLREVQQIMGSGGPYDVIGHKIDLPELQGEPHDISRAKCLHAVKALRESGAPLPLDDGRYTPSRTVVVVEDTCLCFRALQGLPGPYVKWFLDKLGHEGLNNMLAAYEDKAAYALCSLGYAWLEGAENDADNDGSAVSVVEGRTWGSIVQARSSAPSSDASSAPTVFGWDPVFQPDDGSGLTYAEMDQQLKNSISHRFKAFDAFRTALLQRIEEMQK